MPHTILLYEDNATIRELVSALLVDEGYAVREAGGWRRRTRWWARGG